MRFPARRDIHRPLTLSALALLMTACGSDDSTSNNAVTPAATLTGTVAVGAAVGGASINAKCVTGSYTTTSKPNGSYGMVIPSGNFPCAVKATGSSLGSTALHSMASAPGTANITPLTDLALALQVNTTAGQDLATWFANPSSLATISSNLSSAADSLRAALVAAGYTVPVAWTAGSSTPFNGSFTPDPLNDPFDRLLEALADAISDPSSTYADYSALLIAFVATPTGTLPTAPGLPVPAGTGAALGSGDGVTGTHNGTAYTYTNVSIDNSNANFPALIIAKGASNNDYWRISPGAADQAPGLYDCNTSSAAAPWLWASLGVNGTGAVSTLGTGACRIEIISNDSSLIEGRFVATLPAMGAIASGDVLDGYFRFHKPVVSGPETQPATVHASLVRSYSLVFDGNCGSACPFVDGQTYSATVNSNNTLSINSKTLTNPVNNKVGGSFNLNEAIWADGNLRYALSNNQTGVFNEINVNDTSQLVGGLPKFLGQFTAAAAPSTPLSAVQALADSYVYEVQATGTAYGDLGLITRGLRIDTGYPACDPISQSDTSKRWKARIVIGSNGSVSLQNTGNASQAITLTPGSVSADDNTTVGLYPYSTAWSMANPGSKVYEVKRAIRYNDGVHPTPLTEYFSIQLGVDSSGKLGNVGLQGASNSPRMAFCPVTSLLPEPADRLAPLKVLAGSYTIGHDYLTDSPTWTTPGWTGVSIGTNGSVTFAGSGPSFSPSEITDLRINRRNENNNGTDNSIWGLTALINRDINGDSAINEQDRVNFFLTETGALRDIQYKDSSTHLVEVSVLGRQLPAYDDTLASSLTGNGVSGKIDGTAYSISSTETFTRIEVYNSGRVDFFAGRNKYPDVPAQERRAWRITVGTTALQTNTPYACANGNPGSIYQGTAVLFDNSYGILSSAGAGFAVQPSHNSRAGGDCEITLTSFTKNSSGILTGVEGKFRATVWIINEKRYVPAVGFFRLTAP